MSIVDEPEKWVNLEIVADHTEKQTIINQKKGYKNETFT